MTVPIRLSFTTLYLILLVCGGCSAVPGGPSGEAGQSAGRADAVTAPTQPVFAYRVEIIGRSANGRSIPCRILGNGPDVTLILATIHGDESAGTPLVERLHVHLRDNPWLLKDRTVLLVPVANPDGRSDKTRFNANGVDLNRNFPTENFRPSTRHGAEPLSEPEALALHELIDQRPPHRIVSIHQPVRCIDYDGPALALAETMAAECDLPVRKLGAKPGSLGSYAGETLGIPIVTVELPGSASQLRQDELWQRYGSILVAAITGEDAK